jgi:hypothetical protein
MPATSFSENSGRSAMPRPYDPPASTNVAPNESAAAQSPVEVVLKHDAADAPMPSEAKSAPCSPTSLPTVIDRYGWAFATPALPPKVVNTPSAGRG